LSHAIVLFVGLVSGFLVVQYGDVLLRYPVESVLVAGLLAGVITLGWAARQLLRSAAERVDAALDEELGARHGTGSGRRIDGIEAALAEWVEFRSYPR
jgi:hypothetical protein